MTKTNFIIIQAAANATELCKSLREAPAQGQFWIVSPGDLDHIQFCANEYKGFATGIRLTSDEAKAFGQRVGRLNLGDVDVDDVVKSARLCPNAVELHLESFTYNKKHTTYWAFHKIRELFPHLRRLVVHGGDVKATALVLEAFGPQLVSFELYAFPEGRDQWERMADIARLSYCVTRCPKLRHVSLPFWYAVEAPFKSSDADVWEEDEEDWFHMDDYGNREKNTRLSFVEHSTEGLTMFIRKEKRLVDWKWALATFGMAFVEANAGHHFHECGVTVGGGLIQQIGGFIGGDQVAELVDEFNLHNDQAIADHTAEVKVEKEAFYPSVQRFVFDTRFGRYHIRDHLFVVHQRAVAKAAADIDVRMTAVQKDDEVMILESPPPPVSRPRLPGPSRKNKRKEGPE